MTTLLSEVAVPTTKLQHWIVQMLLIYSSPKPGGLILPVGTEDLSSTGAAGSPEDQAVTHSGASASLQLQLLLWKVLHHRPHPHPPKLNKSNDCNRSKWPTLSTASKGWLTFKLWYLSCGAFGQSFMACVASQGHSHSTASKQKAYLLTSCILRNVKIKAIHRID